MRALLLACLFPLASCNGLSPKEDLADLGNLFLFPFRIVPAVGAMVGEEMTKSPTTTHKRP